MSRSLLSMLPWEEIDKAQERVKLEIANKKAEGKLQGNDEGGNEY